MKITGYISLKLIMKMVKYHIDIAGGIELVKHSVTMQSDHITIYCSMNMSLAWEI